MAGLNKPRDLPPSLLEKVISSQRLAADPATSVWVSASAGAGKTKVLTDRLLRLLLEGVPAEKILCLTFTRAAASEMRQRLLSVLEAWCLEPPGEALTQLLGEEPSSKMLKKAQGLFYHLIDHQERLRIMTLHGFCQSVLQQFPLEGRCLPGFRILEDSQTLVLKNGAFQMLLGQPDLKEALSTMLDVMAPGHLQQLLEEAPRHLWMPLESLKEKLGWSKPLESFILNPLLEGKLSLFERGSASDQERGETIKKFLKGEIDFKSLVPVFLTQTYESRAILATKALLKNDETLEEILKQEALRLQDHLRGWEIEQVIRVHQAFMTLHQAMQVEYGNLKQAQGACDFQDIMEKTFQLFNDPALGSWVLFKITQNLDHLLVDEAQDTSSLQWAIVLKLTEDFFAGQTHRLRPPTLFVVGDFKQSIYSFQGAEPHLFQSMQTYYHQKITEACSAFRQVSLDASFRSTPQVLDVVDRLFRLEPLRQAQPLSHESMRVHSQGTVQRWPVIYHEDEAQASFMLADRLASFIADSLKHGFMTAAGSQKVSPSDFLILIQRRHRFLYQLIRSLKRYGVPVMGADRYELKDDLIIKDMMALCRFLLFPYDNFSLVTVLLSPLVGWPYEKILPLLQHNPHQPLWQKLSKDPTLGILRDWLKKTDHIHPSELLFEIIKAPLRQEAIKERLGIQAIESLDALLETVLAYEADHVASLQDFIEWFENQSVIIKRDVAQNPRDQVRMMTVHGAKGLQAPIVILPDTLRIPDRPPLFLEEGGELILNKGGKYLHPYLQELHQLHQTKTQEEYQRLLYVALTRAENHLVIAGWANKAAVPFECWYHWLEQVIPQTQASFPGPQSCPRLTPLFQDPNHFLAYQRPEFMDKPVPYDKRHDFETAVDPAPVSKGQNEIAFREGKKIHQALENYMLTRQPSPLIQNILAIPLLKELLDQAYPEVPLIGMLEGQLYSVRLDCLVGDKNSIKIIDFKSDRQLPDRIPSSYQAQLVLYKRLAEKIFTDKKIETYILWTRYALLVANS